MEARSQQTDAKSIKGAGMNLNENKYSLDSNIFPFIPIKPKVGTYFDVK